MAASSPSTNRADSSSSENYTADSSSDYGVEPVGTPSSTSET